LPCIAHSQGKRHSQAERANSLEPPTTCPGDHRNHRNQFKELQMIRKAWMFTALLLVLPATTRLTAQQYGPPATGATSAILFVPGTVTLVAGLNGEGYGGDGGPANSATTQLNFPAGVAYDTNGNLFIADSMNHVVRRIDHVTGDISTYAGQETMYGFSPATGTAPAASAQLGYNLSGLIIDSSNNMYLSDTSNSVVWKITSAGIISVFAGGGSSPGTCTGSTNSIGDGCLATSAVLETPEGLALDASGNLYIADAHSFLVREVSSANGKISTFAGNIGDSYFSGCPAALYTTSTPPYTPTQAHLCFPYGIGFDSSGNFYVVESQRFLVRIVTKSTGDISTFAGGGSGTCGTATDAIGDGCPATDAILHYPAGLYVDPANRVYFVDFEGGGIRMVDTSGNISVVLGDNGELVKKSIGYPDTEEVLVNGQPVGAANGIDFFTMDINGNLVPVDADSAAATSDGSSGGYYFPETTIFTTTTTTSANAATPLAPPYILITNPSGVTLNLDADPVITGPFGIVSGSGAGTCTFPGTVAPGASCTIVASFTPTVGGFPGTLATGTISISSNAGSSPSVINLQGIGDGNPTPGASLTPNPVPAFTSPVGVTSAAQPVTLTNTGTAPLLIGSTDFDGNNPTDFGVASTTCPTNPATLGVGDSCVFEITFTPSAASAYQAGFQVDVEYYNGSNTLVNFGFFSTAVSGTGTGAVTLTNVSFGNETVGQTSAVMSATLTNGSATAMTGVTPSIAGANPSDFALATGANACGATVAAGANCSIYVTFTPASANSFNASLVVSVTGGTAPSNATLTGTGTAAVAPSATLSPNPYVFGATTVEQGLQSGSGGLTAITLTNNGTTPITFTGSKPFTIIGPANTPFSVYPNGGCTITYLNFNLPLPAGASCTITVQFFPDAAGPFAATLSVADSASNSPQTITVAGTGAAGQLQFFPAQFNIVAGNDSSPGGNGPGEGGDGGLATAATLDGGYGVAVDASGNLYFSDYILNTVRQINTSGDISVFAGVPGGTGSDTGDNGPAASATLYHPEQIAFDPSGNLYIADRFNNAVREVNAAGTITTFYGSGCEQCGGSAGALSSPDGVATDTLGNVYVGNLNFSVFEISPDGTGSPFAGTGVNGYTGDNGPATQAQLGQVRSVATDLAGNVYIADFGNGVVRKVNTSGIITTYAGGGTAAVTSTPQLATAVNLNAGPIGLATDPAGDLYVIGGAGSGVSQAYFINTSQQISLIAGGGQSAASGIPANAADINPGGIGLDAQGNLYLNDPYNHVIDKAGPQGDLVFGSVAVGSTSAAMPLTLTNTGNGPVYFYNPNDEGVVSGRHRLATSALKREADGAVPEGISGGVSAITGDFAIGAGGTCDIDTSDGLTPGQSCTLNVTFSPTATGARTGTITLYTELPYEQNISTVQLSGTGTQAAAPAVALTPSVAFPNTLEGTPSAQMSVTLSNTGNATLNITGITIAGANPSDFAIGTGGNACGSTLGAGDICYIYVTFTPASAASFTATVQVSDNASGSPQTSTLTGTGTAPPTPAVTLAPNPVTFASQTIGVTSAATTVTLTNSGNATLTISSISITGTNPTDFASTAGSSPCGGTLAAGASCTINVTFTPPAGGSFSATLSIADNAAGSPQTVALSGSGINPADFTVSATPASQTVLPGGSTTYNVTVASTGGTFTNTVALTVNGLPAGATGTFSNPSLTPGSSGGTSTLTVQTGTNTQTARNSAWPLAAPVLAAVGLFFVPGKRRRRWIALGALLLASLGTLTALSGCGGGFKFIPPPQTYTLSITGTSGDDTHSTTVQLTVE
jgi:trimeric autotransporter adhesin